MEPFLNQDSVTQQVLTQSCMLKCSQFIGLQILLQCLIVVKLQISWSVAGCGWNNHTKFHVYLLQLTIFRIISQTQLNVLHARRPLAEG